MLLASSIGVSTQRDGDSINGGAYVGNIGGVGMSFCPAGNDPCTSDIPHSICPNGMVILEGLEYSRWFPKPQEAS